jgi:predicted transcriptional regulator
MSRARRTPPCLAEYGFPYVHAMAGRIRVKAPRIKKSAANARLVERHLSALWGITAVAANPTTGNILIHYDVSLIEQHEVLESLRLLQFPQPTVPSANVQVWMADGIDLRQRITDEVSKSLCQFLLKLALRAAIAAIA